VAGERTRKVSAGLQLPARPRFSVVVPLYNKQAHIAATLASVADQTYHPCEVIVIDDGSTDDSASEVLAANLTGLRIVAQSNAGPALARNRGIAEAAGDWIAFLDADDLWLPDHLETLAGLIDAYPIADVVSSGYVRARRIDMPDILARRRPRQPLGLVDFLNDHQLVHTSVTAVRAATLREQGGFRAKWPGEDLELWTRLALDRCFAIHRYVTGIYVQGTGGAMDSQLDANDDPGGDPALQTIEQTLADEAFRDRHEQVVQFRARLLRAYSRGALFHGRTRLARDYLAALRAQGGSAPVAYRLLARLPSPLLRSGMRLYSRMKHSLRRNAAGTTI
jgi:glycosyltransferase involved in cell wall biosynthesis